MSANVEIAVSTHALCQAHVALVYRRTELERIADSGPRELDRVLACHELVGLNIAEAEITRVLDAERMKAVAA